MKTEIHHFEVVKPGLRLDVYLSSELNLCSRSQVKERFVQAKITGKKTIKLSSKLEMADIVEVELLIPQTIDLIPQKVDFEIIFENESVMVINKPHGLVVHPAAGNYDSTLANGILHHLQDGEDFDDELRPGIVHRLDKDTSGLLIIAKTTEALAFLSQQFAERRVEKVYLAISFGKFKAPWTIGGAIKRDPHERKRFMWHAFDGKPAETSFKILQSTKPDKAGNAFHLVEARPKTGRTHQIRVHLLQSGLPIVDDPIYGKARSTLKSRLLLHAQKLKIILPHEHEGREFCCEPGEDFYASTKNEPWS